MDSSTAKTARRQIGLIGIVAIALIFVFGVVQGSIPLILSFVGAAVAIIGWAYAVITAIRAKQFDWLILLVIGGLITLGLIGVSFVTAGKEPNAVPFSIAQLGFMPLAFITMCYGSVSGEGLLARGPVAYLGSWGLLSLVIGGTLVGGAIGTNIGAAAQYLTDFGFRLYAVGGVLSVIVWIIGLIVAARTGAWGWFIVVALLPAIGAYMFGLFGPTRQDVLMAQADANARRAAGLG